MDKYHIPAMVYASGFVQPRNENKLMSQIDLMPTVLGLLNFSYESNFFGQNIYSAAYQPRAFIATYQDLGYIKDNILTILSPVKKVKQFQLQMNKKQDLDNDHQIFYDELEVKKTDTKMIDEATSYYQTAAYMLNNQKYQELQ